MAVGLRMIWFWRQSVGGKALPSCRTERTLRICKEGLTVNPQEVFTNERQKTEEPS